MQCLFNLCFVIGIELRFKPLTWEDCFVLLMLIRRWKINDLLNATVKSFFNSILNNNVYTNIKKRKELFVCSHWISSENTEPIRKIPSPVKSYITHTHAGTHECTQARTHARKHTCMHACRHASTHALTPVQQVDKLSALSSFCATEHWLLILKQNNVLKFYREHKHQQKVFNIIFLSIIVMAQ